MVTQKLGSDSVASVDITSARKLQCVLKHIYADNIHILKLHVALASLDFSGRLIQAFSEHV